jgi:hypothetical protein
MCKQLSAEPSPRERVKATLYLEDGSKFEGYSFGAAQGVGGEVGMCDLYLNLFRGFVFYLYCPRFLIISYTNATYI